MNTNTVNKEIEVNSFYFTNHHNLKSFPKKITYENHQYSFIDSGLQYLVKKGQHIIRLFDMTDGTFTYRLKNEDNQWTLVNIRAVI
ncbi:MAG: hypothetical protein NVSMB46_05790 [Candidatus Saccharimonadales bacterium]